MKIRHVIIAVMLAVVCVLFTGCSSYVSVYRTPVGNGMYTVSVDVYADKNDMDVLEKNGASLQSYLGLLVKTCSATDNGGQYSVVKDGAGNLYATLMVSAYSSDLINDDYSSAKTQGFFFNTHTIRFKNPLDTMKNAYKNGMDKKPDKGSADYLVWVLLNGEGALKSFTEYFGVDKSFADELVLNFLVKTRMLYESDSATVDYLLTQKYFKWTTTVEGADGYIEYRVMGINSWVWYLTAMILGLIVVLIVWLVARKRKEQPALRDDTELEKMRAMKNNIPPNARVVTPPPPKPSDGEIFSDGDGKDE
ncbi:MAG: hypothetical protein J6C23_03675 [Clostridia bacterium]|nr:hypothetical protein [Clostridia bacterium]